MGFNGAELQMLHKDFCSLTAAMKTKGNHAAGAARQILFAQFVVLVAFQAAVLDPVYLFVFLQIFSNGLGIGAMLLHAEGETLQTQIQNECTLGRLNAAEVTHQLCSTLGDKGTAQTEPLCVGNTMIAVIGSCQAGELIGMGIPVKLTAVNNTTTNCGSMAIHILGGGVGDNVGTPLKGTAVNGGCKGIVHNQGNTMGMGCSGKFLNVQNSKGRIGNGLAKYRLGIGAEGSVQLFLCAVRVNESGLQTHFLHGNRKQIKAAAIDCGAGNNVVAAACNVENGKEICSLTGGGQHSGAAAFQCADLCSHGITGGICQAGVEVALCLQVEELAHILRSGIFKSCALNNGDLAGLTVAGHIASLNAQSLGSKFLHNSHLIVSQNITLIVNAGRTFVNNNTTPSLQRQRWGGNFSGDHRIRC